MGGDVAVTAGGIWLNAKSMDFSEDARLTKQTCLLSLSSSPDVLSWHGPTAALWHTRSLSLATRAVILVFRDILRFGELVEIVDEWGESSLSILSLVGFFEVVCLFSDESVV
jgi:hypothetical protein